MANTALELIKGRAKFLRKAIKSTFDTASYSCPICSHDGRFFLAGTGAPSLTCPSCRSRPRQRLLSLAACKMNLFDFSGRAGTVLHFAAEPSVERIVRRANPKSYLRADIRPERGDIVLNIEDIALPDASYDMIICSHVLEHVDDRRALSEMFRILRPGGRLITMVPLIEGWDQTYENAAITSWHERKVHFGGGTHIRFYGRDFRERLGAAGFTVTEYCAAPEEVVRHGLIAGERVFVATKP